MKPLLLTMQAFGSYGEKTVIDFTKLNQNLFLISGDTGSGKSTIFDAIVYALYDESSSSLNKKSGNEMQSEFADYKTEPYVELVFEERRNGINEQYKIKRVPTHLKLKRGGNISYEKTSVELTLADGSLAIGTATEINNQIIEIVGISKKEFSQVAMIAQGEFVEILRRKSNDKKEIFRKLFNTKIYDDIIKRFSTLKSTKESEIKEIKIRFHDEIAHIDIPLDYPNLEEATILKRNIINADPSKMSVVDMEKIVEELKKITELLKVNKANSLNKQELLVKALNKANEEYTKAISLNNTYNALEKDIKALDNLKLDETKIKDKLSLVKDIKDAYDIKVLHDKYLKSLELLKKTELRINELETILPKLNQELVDLKAELKVNEDHYNKTNASYLEVKAKVKESLDVLKEIESERTKYINSDKQLANYKLLVDKAKQDLDALNAKEESSKAKELALIDVPVLLNKTKADLDKFKDIFDLINDLKKSRKDLNLSLNDKKIKENEYLKARDKYVNESNAYVAMQTAFLDAQAGFIASKLVEGEACPVCGSLSHPHPCKLNEEHKDITRANVDAKASEVKDYESLYNETSSKLHAISEVIKEKTKVLEDKTSGLKTKVEKDILDLIKEDKYQAYCLNELDLDSFKNYLEEVKDSLVNKEKALTNDLKVLDELRKFLLNINDQRKTLEDNYKTNQDLVNEYQTLVNNSNTIIKTLENKLVYKSVKEANDSLNMIKAKYDNALDTFNLAKKNVETKKTSIDGKHTLLDNLNKELPGYQKELESNKLSYQELLDAKHIVESKYLDIISNYRKEMIDIFEKDINQYHEAINKLTGAISSAKLLIGSQKKPDLEAMRVVKDNADKELNDFNLSLESLNTSYHNNMRIYNEIVPKMDERQNKVKEYNLVLNLYQRLSGNSSKTSKTDIETFVQRYYLERILHSANKRFLEMSAGQFLLKLKSIEESGLRTNEGLDFMVYSTVTGKTREARTLSGGESFMAALSLALGMADQIKEKSAVINLDMMFIDEGFGSLDDKSRDEAIKVLKQMAETSKIIGIISHVSELKQQIDDQLLVTKDDKGSHARWVIS